MPDYLILLFAFIIITIIALVARNPKLGEPHSNWNTLLDNFEFSTKEFYKLLTEELQSHGIKNITVENEILNEGGLLSHSRLYLKVVWKGYQYSICGASFGNGFFVSWWIMYKQSPLQLMISKIPFIGGWLERNFYPLTFYKRDTASMFMTYAQQSVLKVIDDITKEKGVRLSEQERKPILNDIFSR